MKKTYCYFIIRRYEKGIFLSGKFAFALLLAALAQFSAYGAPANGHSLLHKSKALSLKTLPSISSATKANPIDIKVTGTITDANGVTLIGATIGVKNGKNMAVTDVNGAFSITVPDNAILTISYVGYQSQEMPVGNKNTLDLSLGASSAQLTEVVVIGYGTAQKRDLTGSIATISGKEITDKPNSNPVASLQSKVAGLYVVNNGTPGQAPDIRIRGTGSIASIAPLYVVDGIFTYDISYVNPNDIESMEVLKDPSSLAIFGNQGANGVIIITTKRAKAGQSIITVSTNTGFKQLVNPIKLANAEQFNTLFAEENANNGVTNTGYLSIPDLQNNTDWINAVTRKGIYSQNDLSISNSTENNKFNFSVGYILDQGIILKEQLQKITATINDECKINKWLKIGINFSAVRENLPYDGTSELDNARKVMPQVSSEAKPFLVQNLYGSDSITENLYSTTYAALQNSGVQNPLLDIYSRYNTNIDILYRYVGSVYAEFTLMKNLTFRSAVYGDFTNEDHRQYSPLYYGYDPGTDAPVQMTQSTKVVQGLTNLKNAQTDNVATYKTNFGLHNLTVLAGATTYSHNISYDQLTAIPSDPAYQIPNNSRFWYPSAWAFSHIPDDPTQTFSYNFQPNWTAGFFGRALYNFDQKYYLNASIRRDGSSDFLPANRWGTYWTLGAAWEMTKEKFMENQNFFNMLKLKGSAGTLGDQAVPAGVYYPVYPGLTSNGTTVFGNTISTIYGASYVPSNNLHWETVHSYEFGLEFDALQHHLHFEGTYFHRKTDGAMGLFNIAGKQQLENLVNIQNKGEEFTASWNQSFSRDLSLNLSANITFLQNKVLGFNDPSFVYIDYTSQNNGEQDSRTIVGQPVGEFYGYIVTGVFQSYAQILKSPSQSSLGAVRPGDLMYADLNNDGVVDAKDRTYIGNPSPKFTYGASANLSYKNFNLSADLGGVWGNKIFRAWGSLESPYQRVNYAAFQLDAWHGEGTSNWTPLLSQNDRVNYVGSTYSIENGSYVRIRNLQLGYSFPQNFFSKSSFIKAFRIYINAQNLITWKNNSGYSPEYGGFVQYNAVQSTGVGSASLSFPPNPLQFGIDQGGGAIPRIISGGLTITF